MIFQLDNFFREILFYVHATFPKKQIPVLIIFFRPRSTMLFWGKTEKASSAVSCDTVVYSLPFDSVLIPTCYFLLVFSISSV